MSAGLLVNSNFFQMKLKDFKSKFLQSWIQFVLIDEEGNLLETCNTLFSFPGSFGNLYDGIPFLDSINQMLAELKTGEEISFPCINVELLGFTGFCDYVFQKINYHGRECTLWILMNFSDHYSNLMDLQQQRNESVIQKELLEIEKKNAILAQELLEYKNEELKRVQKLKTDFFSRVSHEIRTPVNGILGMAKLLQGQSDPEIIQEYAGTIYETSLHLSSIVNDVLDLSKIESNKISFEKVSFDIRSVVNAVAASFVYLGKEKGVQVVTRVQQDVPKLLVGDKVRLSQILYNLLSNSFKFTHHGKVSLDIQVQADWKKGFGLRFDVEDTGIGIPGDSLQKIFEPYGQANMGTGGHYGGTGLGLHIVKQLIEQQDGAISVSSEPNKGSTFTFILPFDIANDPNPVKAKQHSVFNKKLKILVGEDNPLNQKILAAFTEKWGFGCDVVENGRGILEKLDKPDYDLIILDYKMPVMDGLQTLQSMRSDFDERVNAIPVILFTGEPTKTILTKFSQLGVKSVLKKPIEPKLLLEAIGDIFENHSVAGGFNLTYAIEMTGGDKRLIYDMIDIFINIMPKELQKMKSLAIDMDFQALKRAMHKIKPNFHYMGIGEAEGIFDLLEKELETAETSKQIIAKINKLGLIVAGAIKRLKVEKLNWVN